MLTNVLIDTERLILRNWKIDDYKEAYLNFLSDKTAHKSVSLDEIDNLEKAKNKMLSWSNEPKKLNLAIIKKDTNEIIGNIFSVKINIKTNTCELGYFIGSKFWNNGYATEALKVVVNYLTNELLINEIICVHSKSNIQSKKVILKSGFKEIKVLKNSKYNKQSKQYEDQIMYNLIKKQERI